MLSRLADPTAPDGHRTRPEIRTALEAVRKHLGMEVAYVSEFVEGRSVFRVVDAPGLEALIKPGDSRSLDDVYCRHILEGRLPELIPDTADYPLAQAMPITRAVPIGAHMSVPLRRPDGQAYGMFCCLSPHANKSLNPRDLQVMKVFADMAAHQISQELEAEREAGRLRDQIMQVIEARLFSVAYQPIFAFSPFRVVGFEALCRFSPEPYRSPDVWFNQAAAAGCGVDLELAVLREAMRAFALLPEDVFISVNASPETIVSGRLPDVIGGAPPHRLVLEVTEHAEVADYDRLRGTLASLRSLGPKLAIDDAGAGFSSLQHIVQLQPDIIKLDMGLTRSIDRDSARRSMVAALIYFARETGCQIVAEGVETDAEFGTLRSLGVTKGQGYLLGRPTDLDGALALLASRSGPAAREEPALLG
jgi:EAL domain-containing protein (putative c-di-GMP-specific phosphodiesterase class I)